MSLRPLAGIRVVDLADEKGELAGRLLADFGADVVRVEPPAGARSRRLPPFHGGTSLYFAHHNANKRGVVLDLESEPDRSRLRELCARMLELSPRESRRRYALGTSLLHEPWRRRGARSPCTHPRCSIRWDPS